MVLKQHRKSRNKECGQKDYQDTMKCHDIKKEIDEIKYPKLHMV
jgi:hypothetical protein